MSRLILIKHSLPAIEPDIPAPNWRLSAEGRRRTEHLTHRLELTAGDRLASSPEPKALETARIIAAQHRQPAEVIADLREHVRRDAGFLTDQAFQAAVIAALRHPDELLFGAETATAARDRFAGAIATLLASTPPEHTLAVVTHGTVLSLYVAAVTGIDVVGLWRRLGLPSYVVLTRPDLALVEVVDRIE